MLKKEIKIQFEEYLGKEVLSEQDLSLCNEAEKAMSTSHSPYSMFRVGAAVRLKSGRIVYGSNQENVAYPSGLCAERVALFAAGANYPGDEIESMAVTAYTDNFTITEPVGCCGACLQVMAEYENKQGKPFEILLHCINGPVWKTTGVKSFLPFMFLETRLAKD
ncbi:MAG TPA: cytidine deaminase [Sphingobacteriaceae bacterium]